MSNTPTKIDFGWSADSIKTLIITVAAIVGTGMAAYLIYKKVKNYQAEKASKKEVGDINDELNKEIQAGKKLTLTPSQVSGIANDLYTAMDGYGSNYDMIIKNIVKINNQLDLLAVIKSFGVRELSSGRLNPEPNFKGTLGQALAEELSAPQLTAINLTLAKKGIKNRF